MLSHNAQDHPVELIELPKPVHIQQAIAVNAINAVNIVNTVSPGLPRGSGTPSRCSQCSQHTEYVTSGIPRAPGPRENTANANNGVNAVTPGPKGRLPRCLGTSGRTLGLPRLTRLLPTMRCKSKGRCTLCFCQAMQHTYWKSRGMRSGQG